MDYYAYFRYRFPDLAIEKNYDLSLHTSVCAGGKAEGAVFPKTISELAAVLAAIEEDKIPVCFLGAGCNSLFADGIFHGIVVCSRKLKSKFLCGDAVFAEAGVTGGELIGLYSDYSFSGCEFLFGIPTSVGGGITMNAGVKEGHFSDLVEKVVAVRKGEIITLSKEECRFGEKESIFQEGIFVAAAYLKYEKSTAREIEEKKKRFEQKRRRLPKGRSMGCTFVNPDGMSAGELIDRCGLKGMRVGGATVSEEHANFIINQGNSSSDVAELIRLVKERVKEQTGIILREEVRFLP